jgi:uncharacterized protein (DUF1330 family)
MAKGYWVGHVDVTEPEAYKKYVEANGEAFAKFGARFIVAATSSRWREGREPETS